MAGTCAPQKRLDEIELKAATLMHFLNLKSAGTSFVVANEYSTGHMRPRIDLAILGRLFVGIEIKSEFDSLRRLPHQIEAYQKCFDQVFIVVAEKHLARARLLIPDEVGLCCISRSGIFSVERAAITNFQLNSIDLAKMLTVDRLRRLVEEKSRSTRNDLLVTAGQYSLSHVKAALHAEFILKFQATSDKFLQKIRRRKVQVGDLSKLSRFAQKRELQKEARKKSDEFWKSWELEARLQLSA